MTHHLRPLVIAALLSLACGGDDGNGAHDASIDAAVEPLCTPVAGVGVADLRLVEVASGLTQPLYLTAPEGDRRLFIIEQPGRIRVVVDGQLLATPYLDITDRVVNTGSEEGLLGLAFDSDFANNGRFYVNYTGDGTPHETVIASYVAASAADNVAHPDSEVIRLTIPQEYSNHNGGMMTFGPDGYLYVGMGDGGSGGDPNERGQDPGTLLGSLLRLDVRAETGYDVPADNPFASGGGAGPVYAYGLRNPWRFSFDRQTGDIYIADVGQNRVEEINALAPEDLAGANFGWDEYEGSECFNDGGDANDLGTGCTLSGTVQPILEYGHTGGGKTPPPANPAGNSITGGYVYRGDCLPDVRGAYFYGDFTTDIVRTLRWNGTTVSDEQDISDSIATGANISGVASFGQDALGELYLISYNGNVYRIAAP